jgi:hypothetical protein
MGTKYFTLLTIKEINMRYAIQDFMYGKPCIKIINGETPFPEGAIWPVPEIANYISLNYLKIENGYIVEKTDDEKKEFDDARRKHKPLKLKQVENKFLLLCDQLTGGQDKTKLGFDTLQMATEQIQDVSTKIMVSLQLLAIDAEAKREGGLLWWDDCNWNIDI